jgi:hypothetical protein
MPRVRSQRIGAAVGSAGTTSSPRGSTEDAVAATAAGAAANVTVVPSRLSSRAIVGAPAPEPRTTTATSGRAVATCVVGCSSNGLAARE